MCVITDTHYNTLLQYSKDFLTPNNSRITIELTLGKKVKESKRRFLVIEINKKGKLIDPETKLLLVPRSVYAEYMTKSKKCNFR